MSFSGGIDRIMRDPIAFVSNFSSKEILELIIPNEKYENKPFFNAINISQNISRNKFKLSIFNINNWNIQKEIKENDIIFKDYNYLNRKEEIYRDIEHKNNIFNISLVNNNTEKIDFYYNINVKNSYTDICQDKLFSFVNSKNNHKLLDNSYTNSINQLLDINYQLSENHAQGIIINLISSKRGNKNLDDSDVNYIFHPIFNLHNNYNSILHNNLEENRQIKFNFQHKYNFLTYHLLGINANFNSKKQNMYNNFSINSLPNNDYSNHIYLNNDYLNVGLEYLFKNRSITISIIGDFINLNTKFSSKSNNTSLQDYLFLSKSKIEYKNRKLGEFKIDYQRYIQEISSYYYYLDNYLISNTILFKGMIHPKIPIIERLIINYNKKSGYYGYNIDLKYNYYNQLKGYVTDTETTTLYRTNTIDYLNNTRIKNSFDIRLEKQILNKKISIIYINNISKEKQLTRINQINSQTKVYSKNFNLNIKSRFKGNYNFEAYNNYTYTNYHSIFTNTKSLLNELGMIFNFNPIEKLSINSDLSINKDIKNNETYSKSKLKLYFHANSNTYFELLISNILNSKRKISINNENFISYYQKEYLMPRLIYAGINYKF